MQKAFILASVFMSAALLSPASFASVNDDQVTSQKIKEADGTSGQNTNSGSGVKTNHIQDSAVSTAKIANGAVSTSKLLDGAVTAVKLGIVCPDGQYLQYTVTGGWVCSVGTPGPAGPQGPAGTMPHYANVVVIAKSGGDFIDPISAMASITDASAANPYLVKIMPGIYDIGPGSLQMKEYVDIEGSGETVTKITGNVSNGFGVVMGSNNAELRFLSVENAGSQDQPTSVAIGNLAASPRISNVTATAASYAGNPYNSAFGMLNQQSASPLLSNVSIRAQGIGARAFGIHNDYDCSPVIRNSTIVAVSDGGDIRGVSYGSPRISDSTITVTGGQYVNNGFEISQESAAVLTNVTIAALDPRGVAIWIQNAAPGFLVLDRCALEAGGGASIIDINSPDYIVRTSGSKFVGTVYAPATCVGAFNGTYEPLSATCQ